MSFGEAVQAGWRGYVDFSGRSSRSAYWWWVLFVFLVGIVANMLDLIIPGASVFTQSVGNGQVVETGVISTIASLALLLPGLAVSIRRLHDTDRSGWWVLINIIPLIGWIVYLVFMLQAGTPGANRYGPPPAATSLGGYAPRYS